MNERTVLVLEDDPDLRPALVRLIRGEGWATREVATVREALRASAEEELDLILADVNLPDGSGLAFLRHLRESGVRTPTILMTGLNDMSLAAEGMQAGAADFLTKPLDLSGLRAAMRGALETGPQGADGPGGPSPEDPPPRRRRLVGRHPSIVQLFKNIGVASFGASSVLIRGESGVGKELVAREIHHHSRPDRPFVAVNCASVPDSLVESVLFGHVRGAFTGATSTHRGRFEMAGDGTLFLDEIGDASPAFQSTILRTLQEGEFVPVGGERTQDVEARIIAATNHPLEEGVEAGTFRADLYYRLQVLEMEVPPLRERMSDLPELCDHILRRSASDMGWPTPDVSPTAMERLRAHGWPGNVRELENVLERALVNSRGGTLRAEHIELLGPQHPPGASGGTGRPPGGRARDDRLDTAIYHHVSDVVARSGGNKREAARRLGISPGRLYRILDAPPAPDPEAPVSEAGPPPRSGS